MENICNTQYSSSVDYFQKVHKSHICIELSASINQFSVHILSTVRDTNIGSKGKKDK